MHDIKYIGAAGESLQLFMYAFILFDIVTYRVSLNDIQGRYENPVAYFRYNYSIKTNQLLDRVSFAKYWVRCTYTSRDKYVAIYLYSIFRVLLMSHYK